MAENLDYKVSSGCWAYDNNEKYRKVLGLLYTWEVAKNVCPNGWHLPTDSEWNTLVDYFGGEYKAGTALKSTKGWKDNGNGDNSSGFKAMSAGYRNIVGSFNNLGKYANLWSSTPNGREEAWKRRLGYNDGKVYRFDNYRTTGNSVRCLRN